MCRVAANGSESIKTNEQYLEKHTDVQYHYDKEIIKYRHTDIQSGRESRLCFCNEGTTIKPDEVQSEKAMKEKRNYICKLNKKARPSESNYAQLMIGLYMMQVLF